MNKTPIARIFRDPSKRNLLIAITLFLTCAAAGIYYGTMEAGLGRSSLSHSARLFSSSTHDTKALEELKIALATEVEARKKLGRRLLALEEDLSRSRLAVDRGSIASSSPADTEEDDSNAKAGSEAEALSAVTESLATSQFDDGAILALGMHPRDVERLHDRWVDHELDREALTNQALREGWYQQPRHMGELIGLEMALRKELQDEDYDRYLYALGKPNRLEAGEVLAHSAGSEAGLRRGDIILRYDDVRMFAPGELLMASSSGEFGRSVALEILRDGRRRTLYVRRGPLGALVEHSRSAPLED